MYIGGLTPLHVYRMWGVSIAFEESTIAMNKLKRCRPMAAKAFILLPLEYVIKSASRRQ